MASPSRSTQGFTRVELIVVIAVIAILASLVVQSVDFVLTRGQLMQCRENARNIHMATMSMANDGETAKDPSLAWPGDLKAKGRIATVGDYVNILVRNDYLKPGDLKIFAATGIPSYPGGTLSSGSNGTLTPAFAEEYCAYKVFLVKKDDPSDTVFLTTKNYTYNTPLNDPKAKPFGDKDFVVMRKGGDASSLKKQQAQDLQIIGKLAGGGTVESAENCLNPGKPASQR